MKFLISLMFTLSSVNALAYGSIVVSLDNNSSVEIAWLGSTADESEVEVAWENGGQNSVFHGDVCYKGTRKEAIQVLQYLDANDFLGDEFSIKNIHYVGQDKIAYKVWDGPNEDYVSEVLVSACAK